MSETETEAEAETETPAELQRLQVGHTAAERQGGVRELALKRADVLLQSADAVLQRFRLQFRRLLLLVYSLCLSKAVVHQA